MWGEKVKLPHDNLSRQFRQTFDMRTRAEDDLQRVYVDTCANQLSDEGGRIWRALTLPTKILVMV